MGFQFLASVQKTFPELLFGAFPPIHFLFCLDTKKEEKKLRLRPQTTKPSIIKKHIACDYIAHDTKVEKKHGLIAGISRI